MTSQQLLVRHITIDFQWGAYDVLLDKGDLPCLIIGLLPILITFISIMQMKELWEILIALQSIPYNSFAVICYEKV